MKPLKTLQAAIEFFSDPVNCREYAVALRWPDGVACPKCGSKDVLFLAKYNRWHCRSKHAAPQFTLKTGTVMEDSAIPVGKWFIAMWLLANCKNGISSYELQRAIGVTQKSAWFLLHRIRAAMTAENVGPTMGSPEGGEVEADETFVGPNAARMSRKRRLALQQRRSEFSNQDPGKPLDLAKTAVQGLLDRATKQVRTKVVPNTRRKTLQDEILAAVVPGSRLYTDEMPAYWHFDGRFVHQIVNHMRHYVDGRVHTNGLENYWSLLKRTLRGTYVAVEPFHLARYADEQAFRFNNRATKDNAVTDEDRFALVASQVAGKRLTYKALTGKEGETSAF